MKLSMFPAVLVVATLWIEVILGIPRGDGRYRVVRAADDTGTSVDFDDDDVQEAYRELEHRVNLMSNCLCYMKATRAGKVDTEPTADGLKYKFIDVHFYNSDCTKEDLDDNGRPNKDCYVDEDEIEISICSADVVKKESDPKFAVKDTMCSVQEEPELVSLSDPQVQKAFDIFQKDANRFVFGKTYLKGFPTHVWKLEISTGIEYEFHRVNFKETNCLKKDVKDGSNKLCEETDTLGAICSAQMRLINEQFHADLDCFTKDLDSATDQIDISHVPFTNKEVQEAFRAFQKKVNEIQITDGIYKKGIIPKTVIQATAEQYTQYEFDHVKFYQTNCRLEDVEGGSNQQCTAQMDRLVDTCHSTIRRVGGQFKFISYKCSEKHN